MYLTLCDSMDCSPPDSSVGFPRQEYWSGLPFPPPGDLPDPGIEPVSLVPPALAGGFFTTVPLGKPLLSRVCQLSRMEIGTSALSRLQNYPGCRECPLFRVSVKCLLLSCSVVSDFVTPQMEAPGFPVKYGDYLRLEDFPEYGDYLGLGGCERHKGGLAFPAQAVNS